MSETTSGRLSNKEENGAPRQSSERQNGKKVRVKEASRLIIQKSMFVNLKIYSNLPIVTVLSYYWGLPTTYLCSRLSKDPFY